MEATVAITDHGWYEYLSNQPNLEEINFWTPSAYWSFRAEVGSPFFFKLKAKYGHAVCGYAFFSRFVRLPEWLAWDLFQEKNGCASLKSMQEKISAIRDRIDYHSSSAQSEIGCILLSQPTFFKPLEWVIGPRDWPPANLRNKKYSLSSGEGLRVWNDCISRSIPVNVNTNDQEPVSRYGIPQLIQQRLGQGIFRVAVMEAYSRSCAITREHSLPVLEASHIKPYSQEGPSEVSNGLLLRADLHRLFDQGYLTVTPEMKVEVSPRLKLDYDNGRTYYPLHGTTIVVPQSDAEKPNKILLGWHNENIYRAA